jgi:hypothetical protein
MPRFALLWILVLGLGVSPQLSSLSRAPLLSTFAVRSLGSPHEAPHSGGATPIPHGVASLTKGGAPVPPGVLSNPDVSIVSLREEWAAVAPTEGGYDWSYFDAQIEQAARAGKSVLLRVATGGAQTPSWVREKAQTLTFTDPNAYHKSHGQPIAFPVFWDPVFLQKKKELFAAMGSHFGTQAAVRLVAVSCANARTDDWNIPHSPRDVQNWKAAGYTSQKLIDVCEQMIDSAMAAFPHAAILMALGNGLKLDPSVDSVPQAVVRYANETYPGRFIAQRNSLAAQTPDPAARQPEGVWRTLLQARPQVAGQMLWSVTNDPSCRMNGKKVPCDPKTTLTAAVTIGIHYGMQYLEIYEVDVVNPELQGVIKYAATELGKASRP